MCFRTGNGIIGNHALDAILELIVHLRIFICSRRSHVKIITSVIISACNAFRSSFVHNVYT